MTRIPSRRLAVVAAAVSLAWLAACRETVCLREGEPLVPETIVHDLNLTPANEGLTISRAPAAVPPDLEIETADLAVFDDF